MRLPAFRRALTLALLATIGLSTAACEYRRDGATRVTVIGDPPTIVDPASGPLTISESVLLSNVAQGLVRFDAHGQIEAGLAERWNVSDDGLSYIFRLASVEWPGGGKVTAQQVARLLRRQMGARSSNPIRDTLGAVREIVPMTDRVIEIRLSEPRPNLLQILARPELAVVRDGQGTGPFQLARQERNERGWLRLVRTVTDLEEEESRREEVLLGAAPAPTSVQQLLRGDTDLV
ncbi:MAG: ABC transporter substrate-binding protein, partial [Pseudomonadota bacterium]|nr:ABC transporter substrate-binding protein [Pseudomonadota bacterium]